MHEKIRAMQTAAATLKAAAVDFPALRCNLDRISASLHMLEINISDLIVVEED
jgi:hypothetical protein